MYICAHIYIHMRVHLYMNIGASLDFFFCIGLSATSSPYSLRSK